MANNTKTVLNKVLSVLIVFSLICSFVFCVLFFKSNVVFGGDKNSNNISVGQNDAASEKTVSSNLLFREYTGDKFILSLDKNGNYVFISGDMDFQFLGTYQYKQGRDVLEKLSDKELLRAGINKNKININNLYYVRASYNEHVFQNGTEYYNSQIHNPDDDAFYFLIYFKQGPNGETLSAIHFMNDINQINFSSSEF